MKQRLDYIDIARGLGILTVIYSHSGGERSLMWFIGGFFIPLFFVVSGFTYRPERQGGMAEYWAFLKKRGRRLLLPYVIFSIFLMLAYKCLSPTDFLGMAYSRYSLYPLGTAGNVFFLSGGNAPLWFLTSMFTACMALWWLFRSRRSVTYVAGLYLLLTYGLSYLPILLPWSIDTAFLMALFMMAGWAIREKRVLEIIARHRFSFMFMAGAYILLCLLNGEPNLSVRIYANSFLLIFLTGIIGSLLVLRVSQWLERTFLKGILAGFGRHSMVIFCLQMLLLRVQNQLLFDILHIPLNSYTLYATSIFKTIVAAIVGMYVSKALKRFMPSVF